MNGMGQTFNLIAAGTATVGTQIVPLSGLSGNTNYWFRIRATNAAGTTVTKALKFKTL